MSVHKEAKRITTQVLHEMKQSGEKIAMLTAYDYPSARLAEQAVVSAHKGAPTTPRKVVPNLPACEFACNGPRRHEGPQGATPRTRSASTTPF